MVTFAHLRWSTLPVHRLTAVVVDALQPGRFAERKILLTQPIDHIVAMTKGLGVDRSHPIGEIAAGIGFQPGDELLLHLAVVPAHPLFIP